MNSLANNPTSGRLDFSSLAAQLGAQPELFDATLIPVEVDTVRAALDEYPDLVEMVMRQYQSALDDADQQAHALLTSTH